MSYEETPSGSHVMRCDTPNCHNEIVSPGRDELIEDVNLAGWSGAGNNQAGAPLYICGHCQRGNHPRTIILKRMFGDVEEIMVESPCPVNKGDAFHDIAGNLIGHYEADAQQGDAVSVKLHFPEPERPPSAIELYDEMLEGTDDDDDALGRVSAVPDSHRSHAGLTNVAQTERAPATGGSPTPAQATEASAESNAPLQRALDKSSSQTVNTEALVATSNIFDNIDTDWDPENGH